MHSIQPVAGTQLFNTGGCIHSIQAEADTYRRACTVSSQQQVHMSVFSTGGSMHSIQSIEDTFTDVDCLWQHVLLSSEWYGTVDTKLFTTGGNMHNIQPLADTQLLPQVGTCTVSSQ